MARLWDEAEPCIVGIWDLSRGHDCDVSGAGSATMRLTIQTPQGRRECQFTVMNDCNLPNTTTLDGRGALAAARAPWMCI